MENKTRGAPITRNGQRIVIAAVVVATVLTTLTACSRTDTNQLQGYVEGEFVYIAAPTGGTLQTLHVTRGMQVNRGAALFDIDDAAERAQRDAALSRVAQAQAALRDASKGKRPTEIQTLQAQHQQAMASLSLADANLARQRELLTGGGATSRQNFDQAQATRDEAAAQVTALAAELKTARLGSRSDQLSAAQANVDALEAELAQAEWQLAQKHPLAPDDASVSDTLYRVGEWVTGGRPVVALLPAANIKVRTFVPQEQLAAYAVGTAVQVFVDGVPQPVEGRVNFIAPQTEFTPPVIYSRENRHKFVTMIEIVFTPQVAVTLHPGQPVDVQVTTTQNK